MAGEEEQISVRHVVIPGSGAFQFVEHLQQGFAARVVDGDEGKLRKLRRLRLLRRARCRQQQTDIRIEEVGRRVTGLVNDAASVVVDEHRRQVDRIVVRRDQIELRAAIIGDTDEDGMEMARPRRRKGACPDDRMTALLPGIENEAELLLTICATCGMRQCHLQRKLSACTQHDRLRRPEQPSVDRNAYRMAAACPDQQPTRLGGLTGPTGDIDDERECLFAQRLSAPRLGHGDRCGVNSFADDFAKAIERGLRRWVGRQRGPDGFGLQERLPDEPGVDAVNAAGGPRGLPFDEVARSRICGEVSGTRKRRQPRPFARTRTGFADADR